MPPLRSALGRLSLSAWILIGLAAGVLFGLFLGEPAGALQPLAEIYIRLMQMTVLPYLVVSLVVGFGQLDPGQAGRLAVRGAALLAVTWLVTVAAIAALPWAFPDVASASFFSHALVEPREPFSLPDIFFTANPFHALSTAIVPAVVLFSSLLGAALMRLPDKERVLAPLRVLDAAIVGITRFVVRLTPAGVFAIGSVAAGTLTGETLSRLEVYLVTFACASLLLAFWVLPLLVTAVTPFRYREVTGIARDALLTAFVANNAFIVLPILAERSRDLLREHGLAETDGVAASEVLIPILFNFPNAGRLLSLLFVPFAAWLAGSPLSAGGYATLFTTGIPSYFAKAQVALPFLLDVLGLPHDLFQLYVPTTVLAGKFDSMVTAMNLLVFALLGAASMGGFLVVRRGRVLRAALAIAGGLVVTVGATALLLRATVDTTYRKADGLRRMHAARVSSASIVHRERAGVKPPDDAGRTALERIRARGTLRVGFDPANPPFSFWNADGNLVGFDIDLAESLADALGAKAEFVPVPWADVKADLARGFVDVMPHVWYRPYWFGGVRLSEPYLDATMAVAVRDERRHEFASIQELRRRRGLKIGVPLDPGQVAFSTKRYFASEGVTFVPQASAVPFFEGRAPELDGYLMPAESGAAMTLLHPEFTMVVPQPDPITVPVAFGAAPGAEDLARVVDEWIAFARSSGQVRQAYDYWVLGLGAKDSHPRWSILRDVLGWGRPAGR